MVLGTGSWYVGTIEFGDRVDFGSRRRGSDDLIVERSVRPGQPSDRKYAFMHSFRVYLALVFLQSVIRPNDNCRDTGVQCLCPLALWTMYRGIVSCSACL